MQPCKAILFDLDGTLLDTAADLGFALNLMRLARSLPALSDELTRPLASHGSHGLLSLGFADTYPSADEATQLSYKEEFLAFYAEHVCVNTNWFEGMQETIEALHAKGIATGIVTNKPSRFTMPIVAEFPLLADMQAIVSGDTLPIAKPDPAPILLAAEQLQVAPEHCWYVGDAERDIMAGRAAGMKTFLAEWGYIGQNDRPSAWGADVHLSKPEHILNHLP
ncbi:phosphoglycolate phosphatase [Aliidiomarina taiwanensis]|uniref:Phosphoglycolate phosphatase n=2 Tax=Aliidiomarina taiwanensis TaxID=946228 RepID=A0A432XAN6_9GAMM|nr:phosphoglycolate phosphatase [Aliidiomarina taiwanensis]